MDKLKSDMPEERKPPGFSPGSIAHFTQGDLRRFIVNLLSSDPGALPKHLQAASVSTFKSPLTTKGDIYTFDTADARQGVGADGTSIVADSTQATGWKWAASGSFTPPTGTGFAHVTAGVLDPASKLVDTADINADQVTYAKMQNVVANNVLLGRVSGAGGDMEELTATQVTALLNVFGALKGLVPASAGGTVNYLRADGTFATPPGTGMFTPTGTGFPHIAAGVEDAAAKLIDTADINADQVTYAKIQNVAANNSFLGRTSGAGGDIEELSGVTATALLSVFGALKGLVPASAGGTVNYLRADGTFNAPPAAGAAGGDLAGTYPNPTVAHLTDTIWRLVKVTVVTASGTYTPTTGVDALYVECVAGGGGGGGCLTAITNSAAAGGGAGGSYCSKWVTTLVSGAHTVTVGAGGAGGVAGANAGTVGADTVFKDNAGTTIITAKGGTGGQPDTVAAGPRIGGAGASAGAIGNTGDSTQPGGAGHGGIVLAAAQALAGNGGNSAQGGGGLGPKAQSAGALGQQYGGGGSGGCILSGGASVAGGTGGAGVIRVWEFQKVT